MTLSSGGSVADIVERAALSIVQIRTTRSSGTGFIIDSDGLVVTNKHVVDGVTRVTLQLESEGTYTGRVIRRHPDLDLAYIEIGETGSFTPIALGDSDSVRVGEEVIAIGFPIGSVLPGLTPTVSIGIISAKRLDYLQTDASINPGNSGGPLLNALGQVVGVIVSRIDQDSEGRSVAGIGFAIPVNEVEGGQVIASAQVPLTPAVPKTPVLTATPAPAATQTVAPPLVPTVRPSLTLGPTSTPLPSPTPTPAFVGWVKIEESDPVTETVTVKLATQAVEHSLGAGQRSPFLTVVCKQREGFDFDGPHVGILWGIEITGSVRGKYWVEAAIRWDDSPVEDLLWHAVRGGTYSFDMPRFIEQALNHETVYIRVVERLGKGDKHYAKFDLNGLARALGSHRELCLQ